MRNVSRREFLSLFSKGLVGSSLLSVLPGGFVSQVVLSKLSSQKRYFLGYKLRSTVIRTWSSRLRSLGGINVRVLNDMLKAGVMEVARVGNWKKAIRELFSPKEKLLIKMDPYNADIIKTNKIICGRIVKLLIRAGFLPENITIYGCKLETIKGIRLASFGWDGEVDFKSGKERILRAYAEADAVLNVANLMADAIGGIRGAVINSTLSIITHPAKYFKNRYLPYIADLYSLDVIRKKIRLNVLAGINAIIKTDELYTSDALIEANSILMSTDAVALDAVGFELLDKFRKKYKLPPLLYGKDFPEYLVQISKRNLGIYHPDQITIKTIKVI